MPETRVHTSCSQCGATDDHPKHIFSGEDETFHHDCVPARLVRQIVAQAEADDPDVAAQGKRALEIRQAALDGTRGPRLLAHIRKLHEED